MGVVFDAMPNDSREYVLLGADELSAVQEQRIALLGTQGAFTEAWNGDDAAAVVAFFSPDGIHKNQAGNRFAAGDGGLENHVASLQAEGFRIVPTDDPMIVWDDYVLVFSQATHPAHGTANMAGLAQFEPNSTQIIFHTGFDARPRR